MADTLEAPETGEGGLARPVSPLLSSSSRQKLLGRPKNLPNWIILDHTVSFLPQIKIANVLFRALPRLKTCFLPPVDTCVKRYIGIIPAGQEK